MLDSSNNDKKTPEISVIIPAYNAEKFIAEAITSVLNQTFGDLEIIVVNDGSTDNTLDVLKQYTDPRLSYYDIKNSGVSFARNYAVKKSAGKWLAFIDADDIWDPNKLEEQLLSIEGKRWSHTDSYYIGEKQSGSEKRSDLTEQFDGNIFEHLIEENFITTSTVLIDKNLFLSIGGFDENLKALEDWKLWLDISSKEDVAYSRKPLAKYRVYEGSTSRKAREMLPIHIEVIRSVAKTLPSNKKSQQLVKKGIIKSFAICSYVAEDSKDYSFSSFCASKALLYQPLSIKRYKRVIRCLLNQLRGKA